MSDFLVNKWIDGLAEYLSICEGGSLTASQFGEYIREFINDHGIPLDE